MKKEKEILCKARKLFMTYGLRSITMDDLAHELAISKKTLYHYFDDKAHLIKQITFLEVERMAIKIKEVLDQKMNTIDRMMKINKKIIEMRKKTPPNVQYDLQKYYPEINKEMRKNLEHKMFIAIKKNHEIGQKEGLIRNNLNTNIIASLQICRTKYIDTISDFLGKYEPEDIINELFDYHIHAIATKKGLDYYIKKYKKQ